MDIKFKFLIDFLSHHGYIKVINSPNDFVVLSNGSIDFFIVNQRFDGYELHIKSDKRKESVMISYVFEFFLNEHMEISCWFRKNREAGVELYYLKFLEKYSELIFGDLHNLLDDYAKWINKESFNFEKIRTDLIKNC